MKKLTSFLFFAYCANIIAFEIPRQFEYKKLWYKKSNYSKRIQNICAYENEFYGQIIQYNFCPGFEVFSAKNGQSYTVNHKEKFAGQYNRFFYRSPTGNFIIMSSRLLFEFNKKGVFVGERLANHPQLGKSPRMAEILSDDTYIAIGRNEIFQFKKTRYLVRRKAFKINRYIVSLSTGPNGYFYALDARNKVILLFTNQLELVREIALSAKVDYQSKITSNQRFLCLLTKNSISIMDLNGIKLSSFEHKNAKIIAMSANDNIAILDFSGNIQCYTKGYLSKPFEDSDFIDYFKAVRFLENKENNLAQVELNKLLHSQKVYIAETAKDLLKKPNFATIRFLQKNLKIDKKEISRICNAKNLQFTKIFKDLYRENQQWVVLEKQFLMLLNRDKPTLFPHFSATFLRSPQIKSLAFSKKYVWAATSTQLFVYSREKKVWQEFPLPQKKRLKKLQQSSSGSPELLFLNHSKMELK